MTEDQWLETAGLHVTPAHLDVARSLLKTEAEREAVCQGSGDTGLMRLCAAQLFVAGDTSDIAEVWRARRASQDATGAIDCQMLCIGGVERAVEFCIRNGLPDAREAIERNVESGALDGFSVAEYTLFLERYYLGQPGADPVG